MTDQTQTPAPEPVDEPAQYSKEFVDKVLTEKKNTALANADLKRKLNEYEAQLKQVEEARLLKEKDFEALAQKNKQEAEEWRQKYQAYETKLQTQIKMGAVKKEFEKLGIKDSKIVEGVAGLLRLDAIKYDESTQTVVGADEEVKRLREAIPQLFQVQPPVGVQHAAPQSTPTSISIENYKAMMKDGSWNKLSDKEKKDYEAKLWASFGVQRKF